MSSTLVNATTEYINILTSHPMFKDNITHDSLEENQVPPVLRTLVITTISILIIFSNIINLKVLHMTEQIPAISRLCLLNLSCADLLVGLIACIPCIYSAVTGIWPYGGVWCQIAGVTHGMCCCMSIWSLSLVSVDRYIAIIHPLRYTQIVTDVRWKKIILCLWVLAFATFFMPLLTKSNFIYYKFTVSEVICGIYWEYSWFCILSVVSIPLLSGSIIVFTTVKIGKVVLRMQKIRRSQVQPYEQQTDYNSCYAIDMTCKDVREQQQKNQQPQKQQQQKKTPSILGNNKILSQDLKALKMLVITAILYITIWGPYVVQITMTSFFQHLYVLDIVRFFTIWLANSNSFVNVFIYSAMYTGFRRNAMWLVRMVIARCSCKEIPSRQDITFETNNQPSGSVPNRVY